MKNYKFKHLDIDGENEYKVFFEVTTNYVSKEECELEIDGEIYLEDHNGEEIEFKSLTKEDQESLLEAIENWIDCEQLENGYNYYQDDIDSMADYYYDSMGDR